MKAKLYGEWRVLWVVKDSLIAQFSLVAGVKPKHKDFTPDDAIHFKMLTENKCFPAVIKNIVSDPFDQEFYEIVLFGKDDKIHETLVKEGRAVPS